MTEPRQQSWVALTESREEVLRLDSEGFHYRGEFIPDAGEAHRLMVEFLKKHNEPICPRLTVEDCANIDKHTEQFPGPEDCDEKGRCWIFDPGDRVSSPAWMLETTEEFEWLKTQDKEKLVQAAQRGRLTWLPHYALPLPS
jgi:hypothetical protein